MESNLLRQGDSFFHPAPSLSIVSLCIASIGNLIPVVVAFEREVWPRGLKSHEQNNEYQLSGVIGWLPPEILQKKQMVQSDESLDRMGGLQIFVQPIAFM